MKIIGVTGGIGSGKSTVSRILDEMGAAIIDADVIAREIVQKGQAALNEIVKFFGKDVIDNEGELNRRKLGSLVFNDKDKLESLNKITHKYITERIKEKILDISDAGSVELIVVDAAIPFQYGFMDVVDEIWVVLSDIEVRIARVMARSGLSHEQVVERIKSQKSDEQYLSIAHKVLINNGSVAELKEQVVNLNFR
jgi:dephospho-CoA kinase